MPLNTRALASAFLSSVLVLISSPFCGVAKALSGEEPKAVIQELLDLPPGIPLHTRLQIVQASRMALGDATFRKKTKEHLKEKEVTAQALKDKVSQVQKQYQTIRAVLGGSIPNPPSIRDIALPSPYSQFELDEFAPIQAAVQQLPMANPVRTRLAAITRSVVSKATITMLKETLTQNQKKAFAALKIDESKDPLKDLAPYLREGVIKSQDFSNLKAETQVDLGRLLQAAVKQNLQPVQDDLKELQARTKDQTDTAIKTLKWVADKQHLLDEAEQRLVDLQEKSFGELQSLRKMVEDIKINKWTELPKNREKLAEEAQKLVIKKTGLTLLKVALYGPLSSNATARQIEAGYLRISSTIDAAKEMKDKFSTLVKTQGNLRETLNNYASTGTDILEIAKNVPGIDREAIERGQKTFKDVTTAINLSGQLASGNFVAAVGSISGLLGGGGQLGGGDGPDAQVVSMLTVIQAKLDKVLENQEKMLASLDQLHNKIDLLTQTVQRNHMEVMAKADAIHEDLLTNREVMIRFIKMQTATCSLFLDIDDPLAYGKTADHKLSYQEKAEYFRNPDTRAQFSQCKEGMNKLLSDGTVLSPLFQLELNPQDNTASVTPDEKNKLAVLVKFHKDRFTPLATLATNNSLSNLPACNIQLDRVIAGLLRPSHTIRELEDKCAFIPPSNHSPSEMEWFPKLLNVEASTEVAETAAGLSPYYILSDEDKDQEQLIPESQLRDATKYHNVGIRAKHALQLLEPSQALLNIGVAQQALLSGDLLLPYLYAHLDEDMVKDLIGTQWSNGNLRLAKNLLMYYLHQQLRAPTKTLIYDFLWERLTSNPANGIATLNETVRPKGNTFTFDYEEATKEWLAILPYKDKHKNTQTVIMRIMTPEEFASGQLEHSPELHKLDALRNRVVSEIASIRLREQLSADQLKDLALISLLN